MWKSKIILFDLTSHPATLVMTKQFWGRFKLVGYHTCSGGEAGKQRERERVVKSLPSLVNTPDYLRLMRFLHDPTHNTAIQSLSVWAISFINTTPESETPLGNHLRPLLSSVKETGLTTHRNISRYSHSPLDCYQIFLLFVIYFSIGQERQREFQ